MDQRVEMTYPENRSLTHKDVELHLRREFDAFLEEGVPAFKHLYTALASGPRIKVDQRGDKIH